jgi:hypothetical protein
METIQDCGLYRLSLVMPGKMLAVSKEPHIMEMILTPKNDPQNSVPSYILPQVIKVELPEPGTMSAAPPIAKGEIKYHKDSSTSLEAPKVNEVYVLSIVLSAQNKLYWFVGFTNGIGDMKI